MIVSSSFRRWAVLGLTTAAGVALASALGGCVSLLPQEKPSQLYRFGVEETASPQAQNRSIVLGNLGFPRAATSDGILTVTGSETAYIAGARWVAPAAVLFREAIPAAFDQPSSHTRVLTQGSVGRSAGVLQLDVVRFEADYPQPGAAPTVTVVVRARLSNSDGALLGERIFEVDKPAGDNRVAPIVGAFNAASAEVLSQIIMWTDASLDAAPPAAPALPVSAPPITSTTSSTTRSTTTVHRP